MLRAGIGLMTPAGGGFSDNFESGVGLWTRNDSVDLTPVSTLTQSTVQKHAGTYSGLFTAGGSAVFYNGFHALLQQPITDRSKTITVDMWMFRPTGSVIGATEIRLCNDQLQGYSAQASYGGRILYNAKFSARSTATVLSQTGAIAAVDDPNLWRLLRIVLTPTTVQATFYDAALSVIAQTTAVADSAYTSFDRIFVNGYSGQLTYIDDISVTEV